MRRAFPRRGNSVLRVKSVCPSKAKSRRYSISISSPIIRVSLLMHSSVYSAASYTRIYSGSYARKLRAKARLPIRDLIRKHHGTDWGRVSSLQHRLNHLALGEGGILISLFPRREVAFDSPTLVCSDTRSQWTTVSSCSRSFDTAYFDLGRVWVSLRGAEVLSRLAEDVPPSGSISAENLELFLLLLRHAFGDGGDLPPETKKGRPKSLFEALSIHTRFLTSSDELITMDSNQREGDTIVRSSAQNTRDLPRPEFVAGFGRGLWQGVRQLGQQQTTGPQQ